MVEPIEKIVALVEPGAGVLRTWPLSGGISCTMTGVEIERPDGSNHKLVVREVGKWSFENYPNSVRNEESLLIYLANQGIPVATPRYHDLSCEILERPFLVLDYMEGSPDLTTLDRVKRVTIMAETLAKIHKVHTSDSVFEFLSPSAVKLRPLDETLNEGLQESKIRSALEAAFPHVEENRYSFRHGDFWPGNMVWADSELAAVIDWEEVSIGDPLFDLAITRLDTLWAYGPEAMDTLTAVYQSKMDIDYTHLPFWDLRVSLRPITNIDVWATSFPQLGRSDVTEATMTRDHRWFVDRAIDQLARRSNV